MNEFTKEELKEIYDCLPFSCNPNIKFTNKLFDKIQFMLENYCEPNFNKPIRYKYPVSAIIRLKPFLDTIRFNKYNLYYFYKHIIPSKFAQQFGLKLYCVFSIF